MSLNRAQFKDALRQIYTAAQSNEGTAEDNMEAFISSIVEATATFIQSGEIVYKDGLIAGQNPVTGTFIGNIQ